MFKKLLYLLCLGEVTAKCGHKTKVTGRVEIVDEKGRRVVGTIENVMNPDNCIECIKKEKGLI